MPSDPDRSLLDDPIGNGLRGAHQRFARVVGSAIRYPAAVSPFFSVGTTPTDSSWADLRTLAAGEPVVLFRKRDFVTPDGWTETLRLPLAQMTDDDVAIPDALTATRMQPLGVADVPEMLRLADETKPGPFEAETVELGGYLGVFDGARLVAMAGRRMHPPGFVEISAVCTDAAYRGRGYARDLMLEVLRGIRQEGARGFLHVTDGNPARAVYERLGFVAHRDVVAVVLEAA